MKLSPRCRPALVILALSGLVFGLQQRSSALILIEDVSKERAKELGITVRVLPSANEDARVQVDFKTTGPLKGFRYANLTLTQGGKRLVTTPVLPRKPAIDSPEESKQLEFYMDPAYLPHTTVTVVTYSEPLTGIGHRLKMKDFLPQTSSR